MADATAALTLPPLYRAIGLADGESPLEVARARAGVLGAGTLLLGARRRTVSLAVILEPEMPLAQARGAFYAGMSALAEAVAAHGPPDRSVAIAWPDTLYYDAARLGGGTLAWPGEARADAVPEWLVFAADLIGDRDDLPEPGRFPETTSLAEEEVGPLEAVIESFASHLMRNLDTWAAVGFAAMTRRYLARMRPAAPEMVYRIGAEGDLIEGSAANVAVRRALEPGLRDRRWFDPARGGPRL